jgi:hypothetical protein
MDVIAAQPNNSTSTSACNLGACEHVATPCSSLRAVVLCPVGTTSKDPPCSVAIIGAVSALLTRGSADFQAEQRIN